MDPLLANLAELFKALAEPTRLGILKILTSECKPVSAIVAATERSQPLVSHHLRVLRQNGLARTERHGNHIFY